MRNRVSLPLCFAFSLLLSGFEVSFLFAQEQRAQDTPVMDSVATVAAPAATITPRPKSVQIVEWELQMAESNFALNSSNGNRSRLLMALERFVVSICMPTLAKQIIHKSIPDTDECKRTLAELLSLDTENPVAVCARDGIDSKSCASASRSQAVEAYTLSSYRDSFSGNPETAEMDLAFKLADEKNVEQIKKVQIELGALGTAGLAGGVPPTLSPLDISKQRNLFRQYLLLSCNTWRVAFVRRKLDAYVENRNKGTKGIDQLKAEIDKLSGEALPTASPTPLNGEFTRVRYISQRCDSAIARVIRERPEMSLPSCLKYGPYSTECVKSRRQELMIPRADASSGSASSSASRPGGLEEF